MMAETCFVWLRIIFFQLPDVSVRQGRALTGVQMAGDLVEVAADGAELDVGLVQCGDFVVGRNGMLADIHVDNIAHGIIDRAFADFGQTEQIAAVGSRQAHGNAPVGCRMLCVIRFVWQQCGCFQHGLQCLFGQQGHTGLAIFLQGDLAQCRQFVCRQPVYIDLFWHICFLFAWSVRIFIKKQAI